MFQAYGFGNLTLACVDNGSQHICLEEQDVDIEVSISAIPF
jgi:hypothetical protein